MAYDPIPTEVGEINLDDYYLDNQFYNTFTYVHRKFLPKNKFDQKTLHDAFVRIDNIDQMQEKSQQCNIDQVRPISNEKNRMPTSLHEEAVVEQTVKFAKELAPKVVPPSREFSPTPVLYTIKTSKNTGKKLHRFSNSHTECEPKYDRHRSKADAKKTKIDKADAQSPREVAGHSSQDTLDDLTTNNSSSFSLSEVVENNLNKTQQRKRKHDSKLKPLDSDYLEGITNCVEGTNQSEIKIHIMNETEKNNFYDSIKGPIVSSIKEYLSGIKNQTDFTGDIKKLSQTLTAYMQKMDHVIHTLEKIDKRLADYGDNTTKIIMSPKPISSKGSRLEELAEDLPEIKEVNSTDEEVYENNSRRTKTSKSVDITMKSIYDNSSNHNKANKITQGLDRGEDVPIHMNATYSQMNPKQDHPNRIPARFCWTDAS